MAHLSSGDDRRGGQTNGTKTASLAVVEAAAEVDSSVFPSFSSTAAEDRAIAAMEAME